MNLPEIKADLLRKLFIEQAATAPAYVVQDVLQAINSAAQLLNVMGDPFWEKGITEKAFDEVIDEHVLDARSVASVRSVATGIALAKSSSLQQVINYDSIYESARDNEVDSQYKTARIYYAAAERPASTSQVRVSVGPTPLSSQSLQIEFIPNFVRFVTADLEDTGAEISVPYNFIETVFLPIARFFATRSHFYSDDNYPLLEQDYLTAMDVVKSLNPSVNIPSVEDIRRERRMRMREARRKEGE